MQLFPWFTASSSIKYGKVFIHFNCVIDCTNMEKFDSDFNSDSANGAFSYLDEIQKSRLDSLDHKKWISFYQRKLGKSYIWTLALGK